MSFEFRIARPSVFSAIVRRFVSCWRRIAKSNAHISGESVAVQAGTAIHFPSGLVHCLENTGPGEMQVLGVFRPAGSPAEAYYPDGTKAPY